MKRTSARSPASSLVEFLRCIMPKDQVSTPGWLNSDFHTKVMVSVATAMPCSFRYVQRSIFRARMASMLAEFHGLTGSPGTASSRTCSTALEKSSVTIFGTYTSSGCRTPRSFHGAILDDPAAR